MPKITQFLGFCGRPQPGSPSMSVHTGTANFGTSTSSRTKPSSTMAGVKPLRSFMSFTRGASEKASAPQRGPAPAQQLQRAPAPAQQGVASGRADLRSRPQPTIALDGASVPMDLYNNLLEQAEKVKDRGQHIINETDQDRPVLMQMPGTPSQSIAMAQLRGTSIAAGPQPILVTSALPVSASPAPVMAPSTSNRGSLAVASQPVDYARRPSVAHQSSQSSSGNTQGLVLPIKSHRSQPHPRSV